MIYSTIKKFLIIVAATFSAAYAFAAVPTGSITAIFTSDFETESMTPNEVAIKDGVELIGGTWDSESESLKFTTGEEVTIKATGFANIFTVRFYASLYEDVSTIEIISAIGDGVNSLDDLNCALTAEPVSRPDVVAARFFFPDVRLSEITFKSTGTNCIESIEVGLDSEPDFESDGPLYVYSTETVPFIKRTNTYPYRYYISPDTENIETDPDDMPMIDVPEEGIKMEGKTPGKYMLYIDGDGTHMSECMRHIEVNYDANPRPSTEINTITESAVTEYFDLAGRKITNQTKGYQIRKVNGIVEKILR